MGKAWWAKAKGRQHWKRRRQNIVSKGWLMGHRDRKGEADSGAHVEEQKAAPSSKRGEAEL